MRAARRSTFMLFLSALACTVALSCGGSDSTGPGGGNGVIISPDTASVALGSTIALHATVNGSGSASFFWSSENTAVATVSGSGVVTAVSLGTARIAASSGGKSGVATITVVPQGVASVRVSPTSAAINVGATVHLVAEPLDASGNLLDGRTITWSSANDAIATVDNTGLVTGVSTGATTITATSEGKSGSSGVAVGAAVAASIAVEPTSVSVTTGQTSQLTATVKDGNGAVISGAPVSWTVNSGVAIVSSTGLVTGQSAGSAVVTATSGSVHVDVPVTVTLPPANAVIVSPSTVSLLVTQRQQMTGTVTDASGNPLPGQTISWQSSDQTVAAVGSTGLVIAVAPGTATITGTSGSVSGTAHVTVSLVPVRRVTVTPDAISFTQGDAGTQLTVALLDSVGGALTGRAVTFSSNNTGVANVNGSGFVTPGGPGQAVITVTVTGTGISTTATVTVTPIPVSTVTITPAPDTLVVSQSVQLTATPRDASGNPLTGRTVTWDGSDDAVATVSSNGRVTALSPGTMTVTATSEGKTGTATIVVSAVPVASVVISPTTQSVIVGQATPAFTAVTKDGSGNVLTGRTVTWSSSNTGVATIDANTGVATGVAPGTTSITATSEGKTSNAATLTVTDVPVASVTISPTTQSVVVGSNTPAFTAVTKDGSGNVLTGRAVTFSSSAPGVATIDPTSGVATGVSAGTSAITASSEGKTSGDATLTVDPAPVGSVTVSPPTQTITDGTATGFSAVLKDGQGNTLTGRAVSWNSSDPNVATIDNTGNATSTGPGTTTITAMSETKSGTASLQVDPVPVSGVVVDPPVAAITVGSTVQLSASIQETNAPGHGHSVAWKSSDDTIATVDHKGLVTGVSLGLATITATTQGKSGSSLVTVLP